jgi:hypothetical protein
MVYFPTLAELAEQVTPGDKNGPRPTMSGQWPLLAEMGECGRQHQLVAGSAESELTG